MKAKKIKIQLEQLNRRLSKARKLLLSGDLEGTDYKEIKSEAERKIAYLENKALELKPKHHQYLILVR